MANRFSSTHFRNLLALLPSSAFLVSAFESDDTQITRSAEDLSRLEREAAFASLNLEKAHLEYAKCMYTIAKFQLQHGKAYVEDFESAMNSNRASDQVQQVSFCRFTTKGYWRMVKQYKSKYEQVIPQEEMMELQLWHKWFLDLVRPLDKIDTYNSDSEYAVYDMFENKAKQ